SGIALWSLYTRRTLHALCALRPLCTNSTLHALCALHTLRARNPLCPLRALRALWTSPSSPSDHDPTTRLTQRLTKRNHHSRYCWRFHAFRIPTVLCIYVLHVANSTVLDVFDTETTLE